MAPPLRIGLVSPYSLSVPGGVQAQVLGLARELRRRGCEARVLGPCDGPPPESFVTPLGNSLPTAANGSMAPLAPDPSAALRTLRALNDEAFDVIHLHEPMAPGITMTALLFHRAPTVGTFHAAGTSLGYRMLRPALRRIVNRLDHRVVVSKDAGELAHEHIGGDYEVLFNGVDIGAIRADTTERAQSDATRRSDDLLLRPSRTSQGTVGAPRRGRTDVDPRRGVGGQRRARDGVAHGPPRPQPVDRLARPGHRSGEVPPPAHVRRVLCTVARR